MKLELLDYDLPEHAIAQRPAEKRETARLLVVDPSSDQLVDQHVFDWPHLVERGSLVVLNDTSVVKARLLGHKAETGGKVELLLVRRRADPADERAPGVSAEAETWRAIGKGLGDLRGQGMIFGGGALTANVLGPSEVDGLFDVQVVAHGSSVDAALARHGNVPIPPYIRRPADALDGDRYQTVYARTPGAIAAPTAGLHLTDELLAELRRREVRIASLTLHVGLGTFQPVATDDLDQHPMHAEWMNVTEELVSEVARARARGAPVVAVGTTVVRALEAAADPDRLGLIAPMTGETRILIQPGYAFRVVDALLTNFHLPRSTLLALVSAFVGRERALFAYERALARGYRFFSYGDAMWIPRRASSS